MLVGATSWSVWNQSTVNEKVYTVSLLSIALVMWLVVRWGDDEPGPHRDRWLVLIAYVLALTSTNHLMGLLAVPALVVYVLWTDWRVITRPTVLVGIVARRARGHLAQLPLAPHAGRAVSADQRGRAGRVLQPGAQGRAQPGAVRQAAP